MKQESYYFLEMEKNLIWKFSFIIVFIFLGVCGGLIAKDLYYQQDLNIRASDYYSLQGKAEKMLFKQKSSPSGQKKQYLEIYLKGQSAKWFYSSDAPGYLHLVHALRKCQNVEFLFKTVEILKNNEAEIWNAKVCGENVIHYQNLMEYKKANHQEMHRVILFALAVLFVFLLFSFLYFVFRKF